MARLYGAGPMAGQESSNGVLRCVVAVDESLPPGLAANATGMLALTLGATVPGLAGAALVDADGEVHPGLIPQGLTVLRAPAIRLSELRARAAASQEVASSTFPPTASRPTTTTRSAGESQTSRPPTCATSESSSMARAKPSVASSETSPF